MGTFSAVMLQQISPHLQLEWSGLLCNRSQLGLQAGRMIHSKSCRRSAVWQVSPAGRCPSQPERCTRLLSCHMRGQAMTLLMTLFMQLG